MPRWLSWGVAAVLLAVVGSWLALRSGERANAESIEALDARLARIETRLDLLVGESRRAPAVNGLRDRVRPGRAVAAAEPPAPTPAASAAELVQQRRAGEEIVERALAAGTWSAHDAAALSAATSALDVGQQLELQQKITMAINENRLKLEPPGAR